MWGITSKIEPMQDVFRIKDFEIRNRLFVGTGKYAELRPDAAGARRQRLPGRDRRRPARAAGRRSRAGSLLDFLDLDTLHRSCPTPPAASPPTTRSASSLLGRDLLEKQGNTGAGWVKLEVLGDKKTLLPDPVGTLEATQRTGEGRLHRARLHQRRPARRRPHQGSRRRQRHARRQPDRLRPGHPQPAQHLALPRTAEGRRPDLSR